MRRRDLLKFAGLSAMALGTPALSACSVGMAAAGTEEPNLAACKVGSTRLDIERELGAPTSSMTLEDGSLQCTYQYEMGNEPSTARAVMHGGMDVLTLGLWEVVGTPLEAVQGTEYEMTVVYGPDGVARSVMTRRIETAPASKDSSSQYPN